MLDIYAVYAILSSSELTVITSPSFNEEIPYLSYSLLLVILQTLYLHTPNLHFPTQQHFDQVSMALELNDAHIICYHMDATQLVGLMWTYFTLSDYLVALGWISATFLSPNTINQTGLHMYQYLKFFWGCATHFWVHHGYSRSFWCCTFFHYYCLSSCINFLC